MKTRKSKNEQVEVLDGGCCGTNTLDSKKNDPCCEQPTDGSSCCDKTASQEVNSKKTGCC